MSNKQSIAEALHAAFPIMLGYVAIGIPCGILGSSIGLNELQVFLFSMLFYSGAGQFMIPNMWIAGNPLAAIIASVSFVNMRQLLYSASFAPWSKSSSKPLAFLFAATVTDESFGVNIERFERGGWSVGRATAVNLCSQLSWALSNVVGVMVGSAVSIPLAIAAYAMTSIFICLLFTQKLTVPNVVAAIVAILGVCVCKVLGLGGAAILLGAVLGVVAAYFVGDVLEHRARRGDTSKADKASEEQSVDCKGQDIAELANAELLESCVSDSKTTMGEEAGQCRR